MVEFDAKTLYEMILRYKRLGKTRKYIRERIIATVDGLLDQADREERLGNL